MRKTKTARDGLVIMDGILEPQELPPAYLLGNSDLICSFWACVKIVVIRTVFSDEV